MTALVGVEAYAFAHCSESARTLSRESRYEADITSGTHRTSEGGSTEADFQMRLGTEFTVRGLHRSDQRLQLWH